MVIKYENQSKRSFLQKFLRLVNAAQPFSDNHMSATEMDLLIEFLLLPDRYKYQRFSKAAKERVVKATAARGWKLNKININNKLYSMIRKKLIYRDGDGVMTLKPYIERAVKEAYEAQLTDSSWVLSFKFKFNDIEKESNPTLQVNRGDNGDTVLSGTGYSTSSDGRDEGVDAVSDRQSGD